MSSDRQKKIEAGVRNGWMAFRATGPIGAMAYGPEALEEVERAIIRALAEEQVFDATEQEVRSAFDALTDEFERWSIVFDVADKFRDLSRNETIREAVMRAAAEGDPEAKALLADNSLDIIGE